jgi:hypothetical protein
MAKASYVWTGSEWLPIASAFPTAHQRFIQEVVGTSYTLGINDTGKSIVLFNSGSVTVTIPDDTTHEFSIGQTFLIIQNGTGTVSVTTEDEATLNSKVASGTVDLDGQYSVATLIKVEDDEWVIYGDVVAP